LSYATTYYWQVRALYAGSYRYANNYFWYSFTTGAGAFGKISPVDGLKDVLQNLVLRWTLSSGATSYEYCIDTVSHPVGDTSCTTGWTPAGAGPTHTVVGLATAKNYYWQLRSVYPGGATYADGGAWWSFTTVPASFAKLLVANNAPAASRTPTLTWGPSNGATQYEYCITTTAQTTGTSCPGGWQVVSPATATSITLNLSGTTTYYWQVRSMYNGSYRYANNFAWWSFTTVGP
jgi:hypothetical protein